MDILEAKLAVIKAGKMLVENGLIQRTWGNVSCRIDDNHFVITPSGKGYLTLTPEDIVIVTINDLSYDGDVKPSSEKGIHAQCYALRPDVNFVIHTHQTYASIVGLSGLDINNITGKSAEIIGTDVPIASYGLPGTGKLKKGVVAALKRSDSKAVLMIHHGALCVGTDLDDAFAVANELEEVSKAALLERYRELTGKTVDSFNSLSEYVANNLMTSTSTVEYDAYNSTREYGAIRMTPVNGGESIMIDIASGEPVDKTADCPETAVLHSAIYKKREDVNAVIHTKEEDVLSVSKIGKTIRPFLDDFAQIAGITVKNVDYSPNNSLKTAKAVTKALKSRDAVLLKNNGAVCVGANEDEANAVKLVTEKGCKAAVAANIYGTDNKPINLLESALMRIVYKTKYSKKSK